MRSKSTLTGKQQWNATWGTWDALDFFGGGGVMTNSNRKNGQQKYRNSLLPPTAQHLGKSMHKGLAMIETTQQIVKKQLPSVIFSNDRKGLTAIDKLTGNIVWEKDFESVLPSIFGINRGTWQNVEVLDEDSYSSRHEDASVTGIKMVEKNNQQNIQSSSSNPESLVIFRRPIWNNLMQTIFNVEKLIDNLDFFHRFRGKNLLAGPTLHGVKTPFISEFFHRRRGQNLLAGPTLHGVKNPLISEFKDDNPLQFPLPNSQSTIDDDIIHLEYNPEKGGVFLSWRLVLATVIGLIAIAFGAGMFYMIRKEKRHETNEKQALIDEETDKRIEVIENHKQLGSEQSELILSTEVQNNYRANDDENEEGQPLEVVENVIKPGIEHNVSILSIRVQSDSSFSVSATSHDDQSSNTPQNDRDFDNNRSTFQSETNPPNSKTAANETSRTRSASTSSAPEQGIGMIDGIPLIRYSRYSSEFRELESLGKGGFGTVFRCSNVLDDREYAVKKVLVRSAMDSSGIVTKKFSQELHRVLREVKILALLDDPNIVRYYTAWLEMEENTLSNERNFDASFNSKHNLSHCFSSEILTSLDDSKEVSKHISPYKTSNPLGWVNFIESDASFLQARKPRSTSEDCGFSFDESTDDDSSDDSEDSDGVESSLPSESAANNNKIVVNDSSTRSEFASEPAKNSTKHTLYIQMQLCTAKTLANFLADEEGRKGYNSDEKGVDIPIALNLFRQVALAVKHVHAQGLIHRDLKPENCFIYDSGTVKVGDFGLSRETGKNTSLNISSAASLNHNKNADGHYIDVDNTIGVGTRSYASPEQMKGSDYDSSADVYSLGIILFELCYPMYTGMERNIVLSQLRNKRIFPEQWHSLICTVYPSLHQLVSNMLSFQPSDRPNAHTITQIIDSLLEEHTLFSINDTDESNGSVFYIKVKSKLIDDVLQQTKKLIRDAAAPILVDILQYGLRGSSSGNDDDGTSIMEFALSLKLTETLGDQSIRDFVKDIILTIEKDPGVILARRLFSRSKK